MNFMKNNEWHASRATLMSNKKAVYDEINKHFGICLFTCFFHISYTAFWAVLFISLLMFTGICCIFLHFSSVGYCVYPKVYGFLFFLPIFVKNFIVTCNFLFSGKKTGAKICLISTPGFRNTHITTVALISNTIFQYYKEALLF